MNKNFAFFLLNLSVALYLLATGVLGLGGGRWGIGEVHTAASLFGSLAHVLSIVLSVIAIIAGVCVLLKFIGINFATSGLFLLICAIVWIVFIAMVDVILPLQRGFGSDFFPWLYSLAAHLMVLSGILMATGRFK